MQPLTLARTLAATNVALTAATVAAAQAAYDLPRRRERWTAQCLAGIAGGLAMIGSDAVWEAATRGRVDPLQPGTVLPAHESALTLQVVAVCTAWAPVWLLGRGVPEGLRRRGNARPNRLLAAPLGVGLGLSTAPAWWAHARGRAAAVRS